LEEAKVLSRKEGKVGVITINRESRLNAMDNETQELLLEAVQGMDRDQEVRVLILTGKGRAFSAGSDAKEYSTMDLRAFLYHQEVANRLFKLIEEMGKPVIAAVNGYALGGGFELALACDMIVASKTAQFGFPEIKLGLVPGGGFRKLAALIGPYRAKEFLLTGKFISAEEAFRMGIVNRVVEPESLMREAMSLAQEIVGAWIAVEKVKHMVNKMFEYSFRLRDSYEADVTALLFNTEDAKEGLRAFVEKRKPEMRGR
jgi:enoyl-CoA hydratase/carnithine racemase